MNLIKNVSSLVKGSLQIVLVIVVLASGVAVNFLLSRSGSGPVQGAVGPDALLVEVLLPDTLLTRIRVQENGVVQARNTVGITPQVSGQVVGVSPNLVSGGVFKAGETLFRLDPSDYDASVRQAKADVSSAEANLMLEEAEAEIARDEWALVHPGQPIPELVARDPQIAQAQASLESANARLISASNNLDRVAFSLPFSGRIVETSIELGQRLSANQTYGRAYSFDSLEVSVSIDVDLIDAIEPAVGRTATVSKASRLNPQEIQGTVTRVQAELDQETRLGGLIIGFDNPASVIPGTFVTVTVVGPEKDNAYVIPEMAMSEVRTVWVVDDERLERRRIDVLGKTDGGDFIVAPFDPGDGVVISPLVEPVESLPVRIVNPGSNP